MKKSDIMKNKLEEMKNAAQVLLDENKIADAKNKMEEIKEMKDAITLQEQLEADDEAILKAKASAEEDPQIKDMDKNKAKENANIIRAMIKKVTGRSLTEAENALLLPTSTSTSGTNGEGYILPQDIRTLIHEKLREYRSLREVIGYLPATALTGQFPIENFETVTGLVDFADGTDGTLSDDIKFTNVKYSLVEKAAFIKLSNTLLALTDNALIAYVVNVFSKKAIVTENTMIVAALKKNKTVKDLADWKALKSSVNKDLDPAVMFGNVFVTNQDGWDYLDSAEDKNGRPILAPNPQNPTEKLFMGYPVKVFSNTFLPTTAATASKGAKSPIFYGNLKEGVSFVDLNGQVAFATSSEAGFMSNTTIARLIEFIDVVQVDSSDKCYIYGELETSPKTGA